MPAKKGKGAKKGKKSKKKKMIGHETPEQVLHRLLKTYERNCAQSNSLISPSIRKTLREYIDEEKGLLVKFIIGPVPILSPEDLPVSIEPFINAVRQERFTFIKSLFVWEMPLSHEHLATLALLLEKGFYPMQHLELMDCLVSAESIRRLSLAFNPCESLTTIVLDYNEFGDEGCKGLCAGLEGSKLLLSISMCYCDLGVNSGKYLGHVVATTAVRELYLDGNNLECEGAVELIKLCADHAEVETYEREEAARIKAEEELMAAEQAKEATSYMSDPTLDKSGDKEKKKKKKKKGKKKKEPPPPPPVGPWVHKLHLADNGIDRMGEGGDLAPLVCMRLFRKLVTHSKCLEELDLEDNLIGDMGGRELVEGLEDRKEAKLPGVKIRTTHRMNSDTFNTILKLATGLKKKKKKGRGKKKKK